MRARFIHLGPDEVCWVFSTRFPRLTWIDIDHLDPEIRAKLAANPTFEVENDTPESHAVVSDASGPAAPAKAPARRRKAAKRKTRPVG